MSAKQVHKKRNFSSNKTYIQRLLKKLKPELDIRSDAVQVLDELTQYVLDVLMRDAGSLIIGLRSVASTTVSTRELIASIEANFPTELGRKMCERAREATNKYLTSEKQAGEENTTAARAGLIMAPPRTRNYMKRNNYSPRYSRHVHIACTGALQVVLEELIVISAVRTEQKKLKQINRDHIEWALRHNAGLELMFCDVDLTSTLRFCTVSKALLDKKAKRAKPVQKKEVKTKV